MLTTLSRDKKNQHVHMRWRCLLPSVKILLSRNGDESAYLVERFAKFVMELNTKLRPNFEMIDTD